jgi:GNAT superfamily N-acetyltransferase
MGRPMTIRSRGVGRARWADGRTAGVHPVASPKHHRRHGFGGILLRAIESEARKGPQITKRVQLPRSCGCRSFFLGDLTIIIGGECGTRTYIELGGNSARRLESYCLNWRSVSVSR